MLRDAWTLAIEALSWMEMRGLSEPLALSKTIRQLGLHDRDSVRLGRLLVVETVRRKNLIDVFIDEIIKPLQIDQFPLGVQAFLRLFVYQTALAESNSEIVFNRAKNIVGLARSILGWKTLQAVEPFFGSLLLQEPSAVVGQGNDVAKVALQTCHPEWFVDYCFRLWGRREALEILAADMSPPPLYILLNTLKTDADDILTMLREDGVEVEKIEHSAFIYRIVKAAKPIATTRCFREGLVHLGDKSDSFVAEVAHPDSGMTVLDVCCAPGVTTRQLSQIMQNQGLIFSVDYSKRRMLKWVREAQRAGVEIAEPIIADARVSLPIGIESDMVVLDAPCTGTGMFGRLPSFKWRLTPRSIDRMADVQWQLLNACAGYLRHKGKLVYSTSSICVEENEMIVERFLKWHPEFSLVDIQMKSSSPGLRGLDKCRRLYPHIHGCNGLFVANMIRDSD